MSPSMSTPIDTITVSWWPWYDPSILTTWSLPLAARARRMASIVASLPEFRKRHFGRLKRRASSRATMVASAVGAAKWLPSG